MNFGIYLQIEALPLLSMLLILFLSFRDFTSSARNIRRFRTLVILIAAILLVDALNWHFLSSKAHFPTAVIWCASILYFLLSEIISFNWFLYILGQINEEGLTEKQKKLVHWATLPLALICGIIVTSPWNKLIFYIDPLTGAYHRGDFHVLQALFGFGFMFVSSVLALRQSRKTILTEEKREYRFLGYITLLPYIGGILQLINFDLVCLWPFTAAAAFLLFIDFQRHQISVDVLTSLNNRGTLEHILLKKVRESKPGWFLLMFDVDHFKMINDRYGHTEGDRALQITAQALKNVYGHGDSFIARYGGDEFVVITSFTDSDSAEASLARCRNDLLRLTSERGLPYVIRISMGSAVFVSPEATPMQALLHTADLEMYKQKKAARASDAVSPVA